MKKAFECNEEFDQTKAISRFWAQIGQDGTIDRLLGLNDGQITGLIGATVDYNERGNEIEYWIGTEFKGNTPDGFDRYEVSSAKWAVFEAVGPVTVVVPETWKKYIQSGFRLTIMHIAVHRPWKYIKALTRPAPQPKLKSGSRSSRRRTYLNDFFDRKTRQSSFVASIETSGSFAWKVCICLRKWWNLKQ